jgi:hypothetical protein
MRFSTSPGGKRPRPISTLTKVITVCDKSIKLSSVCWTSQNKAWHLEPSNRYMRIELSRTPSRQVKSPLLDHSDTQRDLRMPTFCIHVPYCAYTHINAVRTVSWLCPNGHQLTTGTLTILRPKTFNHDSPPQWGLNVLLKFYSSYMY